LKSERGRKGERLDEGELRRDRCDASRPGFIERELLRARVVGEVAGREARLQSQRKARASKITSRV